MKKRIQPFVSILFLFFLISTSSFAQFKVVAYLPTWWDPATAVNNIDLTKITHVNIAFANPNSSGTLIPADGVTNANVTTVVNACHAKGVKVFMSIGGAGAPGSTYQSLLSTSTNRNNFVTKIVSYVTTYNLDGIDVDIEGDVLDGSTVTASQYQSFVTSLATALHAQSKEMSAALATWFGSYVTKTAASQFDWINIMSYDAAIPPSDPVGQHSPYSMVISDFSYWNSTKGVPGSKLVIGVPFYGYGWGTYATANNDEIAYCDIVTQYSGAENNDQVGSGNNVIYYNGIPTIEQKTNYALQNASGVMIWEIMEDCPTSNSKSLLRAIDQTINSANVDPTITFNNITKTYGDASFTVSATSNSSGAITYSITSGSQYASITSGGQVTITGAGTVTIKATQAAATGYNSGTATATLTINKAALTAIADNKTKVYNTSNPTLTISYTGFVNGDNSSAITAPSISTTAVIGSNAGTYPINLSGGSASNYTLTLVNGTLTITKATPTLSYTGATSGTVSSSISLSASTNSTGTISYSVANGTGTASVSGSTLNLSQTGTVTLTVHLAATTNYNSASATQTITINAQDPTITFNNITKTYGDPSFTVSATSNSSGAITYSITNGSQYATITNGGQVTITGAGTVTILASQAAASGYNSGTASATLTINKADPVLSYTGPTSGSEGDVLTLTASTNSTGIISYQMMGGTGNASMSGNQLSMVSAGVVTIQVSVAADANYNSMTTTADIAINSTTTGVSAGQLINVKLNVYPNPMTDYAFIELDMPHGSNGKLIICDVEGKTLQVLAQGLIEQHSQYTFPMIGFAPGLYFLKLFTDDGVTVKKITK